MPAWGICIDPQCAKSTKMAERLLLVWLTAHRTISCRTAPVGRASGAVRAAPGIACRILEVVILGRLMFLDAGDQIIVF